MKELEFVPLSIFVTVILAMIGFIIGVAVNFQNKMKSYENKLHEAELARLSDKAAFMDLLGKINGTLSKVDTTIGHFDTLLKDWKVDISSRMNEQNEQIKELRSKIFN